MIKKIPGETWKPLMFPGWKELRKKYALSSTGRVASYYDEISSDGKLLNGSVTTGYKTLNLHRPGNNGTLYLHREIARMFIKKTSAKQKFVIHLNHKKTVMCICSVPDLIDCFYCCINCSIKTDRKISSGNIFVNSTRHSDTGYFEF